MIDNYPLGAKDDSRAPWNKEEPPFKNYSVWVNVDLNLNIEVEGSYTEDGFFKMDSEKLKEKINQELKDHFDVITDYEIVHIE